MKPFEPFGDCLQIGWGNVKRALHIQSIHPKSHILVEKDPLVVKKEKNFFQKHPHIQVMIQDWSQALFSLGFFDTIYCDIPETSSLWPEWASFRYSDSELDSFCEQAYKETPEPLFRFLHELVHNGQITSAQLEKMLKKYNLKGTCPRFKKNCHETVAILEKCLASHMRFQSRFFIFFEDRALLYDNPQFHEVLLDPYVEVWEQDHFLVVENLRS